MLAIENLPTRYETGSATVLAGQTTITPTDALWNGNVWGGDLFFLPSQPLVPPQRVETVNDDGTLILAYPWPGDDATEEPYEIRYVGIIERSTAQSRRVLEQLGDVKAWADILVPTDEDRLALESENKPLRSGFRVLVIDDGLIWAKASGVYDDWLPPAAFKGDKGDKGWAPRIAGAADGDRRVWQIIGYVGGEGTPPTADVGKYLKDDGTLTSDLAEAMDVRGPAGNISGVTPFWQGRITVDTTPEAALTGLGAEPARAKATKSDAETGTGTTPLAWAPEQIAQAIAALGGGDTAELEFVIAQLAIGQADALNQAQFLGPTGNRFADSFDTLTYVDVAGAINLDSSTVGVLKPNAPAATITYTAHDSSSADLSVYTFASKAFGTANAERKIIVAVASTGNVPIGVTIGGNAATKVDDYVAVGIVSLWIAAVPTGTTGDVVVTHSIGQNRCAIGVWSAVGIASTASAILNNNSEPQTGPLAIPTGGVAVAFTYHGSTTTYTWAGLTENFDANFETQTYSGASLASASAATPTITATNSTSGSSIHLMIAASFAPNIMSNLTVRSAAFAAASVPTKMTALLLVSHDEAIAGTDYTFECSRDNGTTWTEMTLDERYRLPSGLHVVEAAETDVSGQPSENEPRWRFKTLNHKNAALHDVYFYWS